MQRKIEQESFFSEIIVSELVSIKKKILLIVSQYVN